MRYTVTMCFCLISAMGFAQLPFNIGPKVGANYSVLRTNLDEFDKESIPNLMGGAFFRLKIKKFSANIEALYTGVRATTTGPLIPNQEDTELDVVYSNLDVPILLGYRFADLKVIKLRANAGIVQSFVQGESGDLENKFMNESYASGVLGVSLDIPLIVFDIRYRVGLTEVYDSDRLDLNADMVVFTVGWKIL